MSMDIKERNKISVASIRKIARPKMGKEVSLELFRLIRLIGIHNTLPMGGRSTTAVIGRAIGEQLPVNDIKGLLQIIIDLKIGLPKVVEQSEKKIVIQLDECMVCSGMEPIGERICDFEGAIIESALAKILNKRVSVKETKCNMMNEGCCEYTAQIF